MSDYSDDGNEYNEDDHSESTESEFISVSCKSLACSSGLTNTSPSVVNQNRLIMENRVRILESLYLANLSAKTVYQQSLPQYNVNWNQMSDRKEAHIQPNLVPSRGNSVKYSVTKFDRPGATPGGVGVDVKHGSYNRYLNRLVGRKCRR